jgi:hypothetical protein
VSHHLVASVQDPWIHGTGILEASNQPNVAQGNRRGEANSIKTD